MALKLAICVQQLGWTRCFCADSPKFQCLCMKLGSRRRNSVSQCTNFHLFLFSLQWKRYQAWYLPGALHHVWAGPVTQTERWHQHGHHCDTERQVGLGVLELTSKQIFQTYISQMVQCACFSWFQGKLQRLQHGVPTALPHPCSTQQHGLLFSQTPSFSHTCLKRHHGFMREKHPWW